MILNLTLTPVLAKSPADDGQWPFHSPAPAGYSVVLLQPSRAELSLLGLIECPEMEGAHRISEGMNASMMLPDGVVLKKYPRQFSFRVTATLRKTLQEAPSHAVVTSYNPRDFLLKLGFKLKIYHGLVRREVFPQSVKMIGMPGDIPYDERVFRVTFDVENVPISDRLMLEVLSPQNEVLTHFTFALL